MPISRIAQPFQQAVDIGRRWRLLELRSQASGVMPKSLLLTIKSSMRISSAWLRPATMVAAAALRARPACETGTFERVSRWENEPFLLQSLHQSANDRFASISSVGRFCRQSKRERNIPSSEGA
jgi:hypothetical protein